MGKQCLLKKFGILDVNKIVPYREHPNPKFAYVYLDGDWHTVPKADIDFRKEEKIEMIIKIRNAREENIATVKVENGLVVEEELEGCYETDMDERKDGELVYRLDLSENTDILEEFSTEALLDEIRSRCRQ